MFTEISRGQIELFDVCLRPVDGGYGFVLDACVLQEQRFDLFASAQKRLERVAFEAAAKVERYAFQVYASARYRLDMIVVDECNTIQIDYLYI